MQGCCKHVMVFVECQNLLLPSASVCTVFVFIGIIVIIASCFCRSSWLIFFFRLIFLFIQYIMMMIFIGNTFLVNAVIDFRDVNTLHRNLSHTCTYLPRLSQSTRRELTRTRGEHTSSTQKGSGNCPSFLLVSILNV